MQQLPAEVISKFWSKAEIRSAGECWPWRGCISSKGYGRFALPGGRLVRVHRLAWQLTNGDIPTGKVTDHLCRNRSCVNPQHIEIVTNKENVLRGVGIAAENAKKTHCKNGHSFTPENTITRVRSDRSGRVERDCRICKLERTRRCKARRKR